MKLVFKTIYAVLIAGIVAMGVLLLWTLVPIPGNMEVKIVQSGSMDPAMPVGSIVVIKPSNEYNIGDVITFGKDTRTDIPTTHRIVGIHSEGGFKFFTTKGDANDSIDPNKVKDTEIKGKVIFSLPYAGYILDFGRQPLGFTLLVGIPALILISDEVSKIFKEIRKIKRRKNRSNSRKYFFDGIKPQKATVSIKRGGKNYTAYSSAKIILTVFLTTATLVGLSKTGSTISYMSDLEASVGNFFKAGIVDLQISASEDGQNEIKVAQIAEDQEEKIVGSQLIQINVAKAQRSLPIHFEIDAEIFPKSDPNCVDLELSAWAEDYEYKGLLADFTVSNLTIFDTWYFMIEIPIENTTIPRGAMCAGNFIFTAKSIETNPILSSIFTDREKFSFEIYNYDIFLPATAEESSGMGIEEIIQEESGEAFEEKLETNVKEQENQKSEEEITEEQENTEEEILYRQIQEETSDDEPSTETEIIPTE